jgi:hypothetical protein
MATTGRTTPTPARSKAKPTVHFDIAQAERELTEGEGPKELFGIRLKDGSVVTLRDPAEIGWQEAAGIDLRDPFLTMRGLLSAEDYEAFIKDDFKNPVLQDMLSAWRDHHGLPDLGN